MGKIKLFSKKQLKGMLQECLRNPVAMAKMRDYQLARCYEIFQMSPLECSPRDRNIAIKNFSTIEGIHIDVLKELLHADDDLSSSGPITIKIIEETAPKVESAGNNNQTPGPVPVPAADNAGTPTAPPLHHQPAVRKDGDSLSNRDPGAAQG